MDTPAAVPGELNGATAVADPPIFSESEYRLLLLNHWRMRVCGGNLREHDLGLSKAAQERHRKRRREDTGFLHPMLDVPPAIFSAFDSVRCGARTAPAHPLQLPVPRGDGLRGDGLLTAPRRCSPALPGVAGGRLRRGP
jgi:hypothetical protein